MAEIPIAPELQELAQKYQTEVHQESEQAYCFVPAKDIVEELKSLQSKGFVILTDLTATDSLGSQEPSRFTVIYQLFHLEGNRRLRIKSRVGSDEIHPTATTVFPAASFPEREVYDMFGIVFEGHPRLKRILCPDDFDGHPLRKDFPLMGRGYRDNFPNYHHDLLKEDA